MLLADQATIFSREVRPSVWGDAVDLVIAQAEAAEVDLSTASSSCQIAGRKESGSYYTPSDVADHFWMQFFRFHRVRGANDLRQLIAKTHFVEPSAGSGIFIFTLIRQALKFGLQPSELGQLRLTVIDVNLVALKFVSQRICQLEADFGVSLGNIGLLQRDFLDWAACSQSENVIFVGNPPFVANPRGSRWRNSYADFLEAMIDFPAITVSISLILPVSVCFSRDYADLRHKIASSGLGVSAASYDNIPDCLFKTGKPESQNTNRANSQRCTILNIGGPDFSVRESAPMIRWGTRERSRILSQVPQFKNYSRYMFDDQIPRPSTDWILTYLESSANATPLRSFFCKSAEPDFSIGTVARNFIGIRDGKLRNGTSLPIKAATETDRLIVLQIVCSSIFFEYWRSLGDGFHVTSDLVERFPVSPQLLTSCVANLGIAAKVWERRKDVQKTKLNSGRITHAYDFSGKFDYLEL